MKTFYFVLLSLFLFSCGNDDEVKDYREVNDQQIQKYLEANNLDAQKSNSGLYYIIEEEGTGAQPSAKSQVTVAYKGYFLNGNIFDQSNASGVTFGLQQVIPGWTEGITYFKEGGSGKLLIPSHLGYGSDDSRGIPGGSVLIFDIKLLEVKEQNP
ncbi:FKBP-type peptidyl-prolyl cis-trans isomerase [Zunongwangia pacifica]|uniref:Peptidyl-prolyl cis-trans isomerase n=1 Tax=Zunongwangia pacifica TaxID=2911062 RepID=A0A9X2CNC0_9FLAO|nr:FKBP-type peptidyl-prolyl cis-trans isomerase [Zunongwangia pacifica]MCL6218474.1 FKBP-type peptidyl-prolyl cis-trans isomerase [Zunongwangia pacifica]